MPSDDTFINTSQTTILHELHEVVTLMFRFKQFAGTQKS